LAFGLASVALGLAVLGTWWHGRWAVLTLGGGAPMAPSAALATALLGAALLLRLIRPGGGVARGLSPGMTWAAGALGLAVVIENACGRVPSWEHWLMGPACGGPGNAGHLELPGGGIVGHMAPQSGVLLLLAALALWLTVSGNGTRRGRFRTGLACAGAALCLAALPLLAHLAGAPLLDGCGILRFPLPTALVLACLALAIVLGTNPRDWLCRLFLGAPPEGGEPTLRARDRLLLAGVAVLLLAVAGLGLSYMHARMRAQRAVVADELHAVLQLKLEQLALWRRERWGDALAVRATPGLAQRILALESAEGHEASRQEMAGWLRQYVVGYGYERLVLLDRSLRCLLAEPDSEGWAAPGLLAQLDRPPGETDVAELDPYTDEAGHLHLDLLARVSAAPGAEMSGAVLLQADPDHNLIPLVRQWPTGRRTAQITLWWRKGDSLLCLSGAGSRADAAAPRRLPARSVDERELAVARVARGEVGGVFDAVDWDGVPTICQGRAVPGSRWLLVATVDRRELDALMQDEALRIGVAVTVLLVAALLGLMAVWNRRNFAEQQRLLRAELEQRRLATRLGLVMRHANDVILILDEELRVVEANDRAVELYGCTREELLRRTIRDFRAPEALGTIDADLARVRTCGAGVFETVHRGKDGRAVPVEICDSMVEIDGRPHLLAVIRDISERKLAERALRESEERYRLIAENTLDMIWMGDLATGKFTYVSPASRRVRGLAPEELVGQPMLEYLTPEAQRRVAEEFPKRIAAFDAGDESARHRTEEIELVRPDGMVLQIEVSTTLMPGESGRAALLLGVSRDITLRKRAERALRESEERYRLIAENTSDAIWLYELSSRRLSYVSPAAERLFGYGRDELPGRDLFAYLSTASAAEAERSLRERLTALSAGDESARHRTAQYEIVRRDGVTIMGEVVTSILCDATGWPVQLLGVTRDITERVHAEAQLLESETRYRHLFERNPAPMLIYERASLRLLAVNEAFERWYGYSRTEALGLYLTDLYPPDERVAITEQARRLRGHADAGEWHHLRKDGTAMTIVAYSHDIDYGGREARVAVLTDITERKRAELALQESEAFRTQIFAGSPVPVVVMDAATLRILDCNPAAVTAYGFAAQGEVLGLTPAEVSAPQQYDGTASAEAMRRHIDRALAAGREVFEWRHRRPNGEVWDAEVHLARFMAGPKEFLQFTLIDITARRHAELALNESQARFRLIAENSGDIIWLYDMQAQKYRYVSPVVEKVLGYTTQEVITSQLTDLLPPGSRATIQSQVAAQVDAFAAGDEGARTRIYDVEFVCKDGGLRQAEVSASLMADAGGRPIMMVGTTRDVTQRRRIEAALRESEHTLAAVFDSADMGILFADVEGRLQRANARFCSMLGYSVAELLALDQRAYSHPDEHERQLALLRRIREGDSDGFQLEKRFIRKDGGCIWVHLGVSAVRDGDGTLRGFVTVVDDITERRRAREALKQFSAELELRVEARTAELAARTREIEGLLDSIPDTVLLCTGDGVPVFSHLPRRDELPPFLSAGAAIDELQDNPFVCEIAGAMRALAHGGSNTVVREFDREVAGVACSVEARATPIGSDQVLILLRDITARRRAECEVLANLARERQLSELKSQFISVASHEFRTPLAAAVGSLELLERHADRLGPEKRAELLVRMQRSLGRLTAIMNDVLTISRVDAGRVAVKAMPLELGRFVQDVVREVEDGDRQQHRFVFEQSGGPDVVATDSNLLHHILSNLVGNAVRYSPAGTTVSVAVEHTAQSFSVAVSDEGIGVPEAERGQIFEPFVRGSNVGQIGGTGLGLNIVQRYTELLGGVVELLPSARGAVFRVVIPRETAANPSPNRQSGTT
jgi:PAS domain S-box-containing protein